ncbi:hypothetical protein C8Q75DRAFT_811551 [Abortiporus biennis]|nr:hypothetical protein C8Q75DRAFT_811551 [Abortiporus biennis]
MALWRMFSSSSNSSSGLGQRQRSSIPIPTPSSPKSIKISPFSYNLPNGATSSLERLFEKGERLQHGHKRHQTPSSSHSHGSRRQRRRSSHPLTIKSTTRHPHNLKRQCPPPPIHRRPSPTRKPLKRSFVLIWKRVTASFRPNSSPDSSRIGILKSTTQIQRKQRIKFDMVVAAAPSSGSTSSNSNRKRTSRRLSNMWVASLT